MVCFKFAAQLSKKLNDSQLHDMLGMRIAMLYLYYMDRSNIMNSLLTGIIYADMQNCLIFRGLCRVYPVNLTKISGYLCDIYCGLCEGGLCQSFPSPHF